MSWAALIGKFAKMGLQTLAFAILPLDPQFIGTDGPTVSFTDLTWQQAWLEYFFSVYAAFYLRQHDVLPCPQVSAITSILIINSFVSLVSGVAICRSKKIIRKWTNGQQSEHPILKELATFFWQPFSYRVCQTARSVVGAVAEMQFD